MRAIILPTQTTFNSWLLDLNKSFPELIVPTPLPHNTWQETALMLVSLNGKILNNIVLPLKQAFPNEDDWHTWSMMFIQSTTF